MKGSNAVAALAGRFDRLSLRERALTTAAVLAVLIVLLDTTLLQRLELRKAQLDQQLTAIVAAIDDAAAVGDGSGAGVSLQRASAIVASLNQATARLHSQSAGLIPPQRMTQVIHDVLSRQQGVTLVSLQSLAPYALIAGPPAQDAAQAAGTEAAAGQTVPVTAVDGSSEGPYVHSVKLVVQGRYLDVLAYLQALESLAWHFYWQSLVLDASHYPTTRVTVTLGTVSMSREWIEL